MGAQFKVGDIIKLADGRSEYDLVAGQTYEVRSIALPTGIGQWVNLVDKRNEHSSDGSYLSSAFELVPTAWQPKVGDRVRSISDDMSRGKVGTLIRDDASEVPYLVRFDDFDEGHGAGDSEWWLSPNEVAAALIPASTPTAIVAIIEDGQPKPASRPYVHYSEESATTEAERLALLHPGQEFGVYVLAGSKIADTVTETITRSVLRAA